MGKTELKKSIGVKVRTSDGAFVNNIIPIKRILFIIIFFIPITNGMNNTPG